MLLPQLWDNQERLLQLGAGLRPSNGHLGHSDSAYLLLNRIHSVMYPSLSLVSMLALLLLRQERARSLRLTSLIRSLIRSLGSLCCFLSLSLHRPSLLLEALQLTGTSLAPT